ncbi:hypothetical protein D3C76_883210 [compost metagenome]
MIFKRVLEQIMEHVASAVLALGIQQFADELQLVVMSIYRNKEFVLGTLRNDTKLNRIAERISHGLLSISRQTQ